MGVVSALMVLLAMAGMLILKYVGDQNAAAGVAPSPSVVKSTPEPRDKKIMEPVEGEIGAVELQMLPRGQIGGLGQ